MKKTIPAAGKPAKTESPSRHYARPQEIVQDAALGEKQKMKALEAWQTDAEALQRAEDEGMSGGEPSKLIDVVSAKKSLAKKIETDNRD